MALARGRVLGRPAVGGRRRGARRGSARRIRGLPEHHAWLHVHWAALGSQLARLVRADLLLFAAQTRAARAATIRAQHDDRLALGPRVLWLVGVAQRRSARGLRAFLVAFFVRKAGLPGPVRDRGERARVARDLCVRAPLGCARRGQLFGRCQRRARRVPGHRDREAERGRVTALSRAHGLGARANAE